MRLPMPAWASGHPTRPNTVLVDPDKAYPAILKELGIADDERTQYWMEVAYQILKMDVVAAAGWGTAIHIRADDGRRGRWRLAEFPDPDAKDGLPGVMKATQGKHARMHYKRLRGFLPG